MPGVRSVLFTVEILSLPASRGCRDYHRRGLERKSWCRMRLRRWRLTNVSAGRLDGYVAEPSEHDSGNSKVGAISARASESEASRERSGFSRHSRQSERKQNTLRGSNQSEQVAKQVASAPKRRDPRQSEQVAKQVASAPKRKTPDRSRGRREGKGLVRRSLATRLSNNVHPIRASANPCGNFSWNSPINLREPQKTTRGVRREASTSATKRPRQGIGSPETPERGRGAEPNFRLE